MGKIRVSDLFAETWIIFKARYQAVLPILLKAMLPYYAILLVMQFFNLQNMQMLGGLNSNYGNISEEALASMMIGNVAISLISFLMMFYMIFVYIPATYGMNISILYPGVDGNAGLRNAFKMYGKALGNTLFSYLPALIGTIVLVIILVMLLIPIMMITVMNSTSFDGFVMFLLGYYILVAVVSVVSLGIIYGYSSQMIPLSLLENVPITKTFSLSCKRGRGAIFSYAVIQILFNLLFMIIGGAAIYLLYLNPEGYFAIICVSQVAALFLMPFTPSLNAAMYRLCRNREEQGAIGATTDIS